VLGDGPPDPDAVEKAWCGLETQLRGIRRGYVSGTIAARFFAQRNAGPPPIAVVTGRTGGGKSAVQHLSAGATGTLAAIFRLDDSKASLRQIGRALEESCGLVYLDEVGRVLDLYHKLEPILALNTTIRYDSKFVNERTAPLTATIAVRVYRVAS
jgi:hypothetical protein